MSLQEKTESNVGLLIVLSLVVVIWGGLAQIVPLFFQKSTTTPVDGLEPYAPLQLAGRDLYIREGCVSCHSQMVRPFRAETERYGHYSVAGEFIYDRPFLWGSKRTGPDLHRVGGRYSDDWHRAHLINPRDVVPESIMPGYPWLQDNELDGSQIQDKMKALNLVSYKPYTEAQIEAAPAAIAGKTEMDAMIAYLQSLGTKVKIRR
jgi:cytochrome c oxidase cbb3-type subunit 2